MKVVTRSGILFLMLALVVALGIAPATMAQDDDIQIGFVVHVVGNPFIQQIIEGAQAAADDLGVTLLTGGPANSDPDAQLVAAQDFVAAGADGIAASVPGESMANGLNEIIESGIPVVQFNLLSTSVNAPYVGERSVESGRILGNMVLEQIGGPDATGKVIIGNCLPGYPVLENRSTGVQEALSAAPGLEIIGPFDVSTDPVEGYSRWEAQYAANPDAVALVGLCAPDVENLGALNEANGDAFIAGGYDLTEGNLTAVQEGHAYVSLGQSAFVQGYLPVLMLVESIRSGEPLEAGFVDSGTQIVTADSVDMGNGLPSISFDELLALSTDADATHEFYAPVFTMMEEGAEMATPEAGMAPMRNLANWREYVEPIENEGM